MTDLLIDRIRVRLRSGRAIDSDYPPKHVVPPPATRHQVEQAEAALGLVLPDLLKRLYTEVANGGFGPSHGLLGIPPGGAVDDLKCDLVMRYQAMNKPHVNDPLWSWPERLLPVVHVGCAMYDCIDVTTPDSHVVWFEPNPHEPGQPWDSSFISGSCSLADYLYAWLDGRDAMNRWRGEDE